MFQGEQLQIKAEVQNINHSDGPAIQYFKIYQNRRKREFYIKVFDRLDILKMQQIIDELRIMMNQKEQRQSKGQKTEGSVQMKACLQFAESKEEERAKQICLQFRLRQLQKRIDQKFTAFHQRCASFESKQDVRDFSIKQIYSRIPYLGLGIALAVIAIFTFIIVLIFTGIDLNNLHKQRESYIVQKGNILKLQDKLANSSSNLNKKNKAEYRKKITDFQSKVDTQQLFNQKFWSLCACFSFLIIFFIVLVLCLCKLKSAQKQQKKSINGETWPI